MRPLSHKRGSCSSEDYLILGRDLLYQPTGFRANVIGHKLLNLTHAQHGRTFRVLSLARVAESRVLQQPSGV